MRALLVFALLYSFASVAAAAEPLPCKRDGDRPFHLVLLVHGIAGSARDFGAMGELLERASRQYDPAHGFCVAAYDYDSKDDESDLYKLAQGLGRFAHTMIPELRKEDRVSVVAH